MKVTSGKVEIRGNKIFVVDTYKSIATVHRVDSWDLKTFEPKQDIEREANAGLISQAFNVHNETGLSPDELLLENEKFRDALLKIANRRLPLSSASPSGKYEDDSFGLLDYMEDVAREALRIKKSF